MYLKNSLGGALFFMVAVAFGQTAGNREFSFVVAPYLQQVKDDSFILLWETSSPGKGAVKLGVAEYNVLKPNLNRSFCEAVSGSFHNVSVTGLSADEFYFYQAQTINEHGDTLSGPVTPLHIPDYSRMPVSFAVVGDTQGSSSIWGRLAALIYQECPSFLVHVGDLVQYGPHKDDWVDEFFKPARNLLRFCPLYPAIGNHEMNNDWFYRYFDLPAPEWFYTIKKGKVLFVFVDTNKDILPGSAQYKRLELVLASSPEMWKIMVHHHPVYVSGESFYGNTWSQRALHGDPNEMDLKKLYETYGVDLVLNGHAHFYERTWPIREEQVDTENGVTYITTGGGNGEYSKHAANKSWFDARTRITNHFLYVNIVDKKMFGRAIDSSGNVFDEWTIEKRGDFKPVNAPYFKADKHYFWDTTNVTVQNLNSVGQIACQLSDGRHGTSEKNCIKLQLGETSTVSAYIQTPDQKSRVAEKTFIKLPLLPAVKNTVKGVKAVYVEGNWNALPDFSGLKPLQTFHLDSVNLQDIQPRVKDHFAVRFTGSFTIPQTDVYRFLLESFDGSKLLIDEKEIISNDGIHYEISRENFVALEKGLHNFEIQYFKYARRVTLNIRIGKQGHEMNRFNLFINR
jgi:hypothetical protein